MFALLPVWAGCTAECGGPSCAHAWPAARLVVAEPADLQRDTPILALPDRIDGALADGADWSVGAHDGQLVIGMPDRGAVVWAQRPVGVQPLAELEQRVWTRPARERFGARVALADTDGDGTPELWVGAPGYDGDRGAVYRFPLDAASGDDWDLRVVGGKAADHLGSEITVCADLDGDGGAEIALGATRFEAPSDWEGSPPRLGGAVFVLGSAALAGAAGEPPPWTLGPTWWGGARGDGAGTAVLCDTDHTGDGRPDVLIGAPFAGPDDAGRVYLRRFTDPSGPLADTDAYTVIPDEAYAGWFGFALASFPFGEQRGLVVGAPGWSGGRGAALVFDGVASEAGGSAPFARFDGPRTLPDHFARTLGVGELTGDGVPDVWIGTQDWRELRGRVEARTRYETGHLWLWSGAARPRWSLDAEPPQPDHEIGGNQPFLRIGRSVSLADLDGDGVHALLLPVRAADPDDG